MREASITLSACDMPSANAVSAGSRLAGPPDLGLDRAPVAAGAVAVAPASGGRRTPGGAWRWHAHHAHD